MPEPAAPAKNATFIEIFDKANLIRLVNDLGESTVQLNKNFEAGLNTDASGKVVDTEQKREQLERDAERFDPLTDREERKNFLETLGVTADTPDNFRLVFYKDRSQTVVFKGAMNEDGKKLSLTESLVLPKEAMSRNDKVAALLESDGFTPLPEGKAITISTEKAASHNDAANDVTTQTLEIPPQDAKSLEAQITLIALADSAKHSSGEALASNAKMPRRQQIGSGPSVA